MLKKLLTLSLVLVGVLALSACGPKTEEGPTDLEKISEAMAALELPAQTSTNLTLPSTGLHDVTITWESDNTDVIANNGTVMIPTFTDGDQTVTITAYITIGDNTLTKEFDVEVLAATVKTDLEKAENVKKTLILGDLSGVISDLTLIATSGEATVTWSSGNTAYLSDAGVVTRPAEGAANENVVLTATITVGTASVTKDFTVTVRAEASATAYTSISDLYAAAVIDDYIEFTGTVVALFDGGYFLTDGTLSLGVYYRGVNPEVGDEVHVKGFYAVYNTLYQLSGLTKEEVLSSDNANPLTPEVKTVAEIIALDASVKGIHGMPYTVTGTLEEITDGDYTNLWLVDGTDKIQIYHYSLADSLAVLEAYKGKEVTFTGTYYTFYKSAKVYFAFDGTVDDVEVTLTPQEAFDGDVDVLEGAYPIVSLESITLPTSGVNGTVFSAWTSDTTAIYGDDGVFAAVGAVSTTVTFTGTATYTDTETSTVITDTVSISVVVPVLSTVAEVLAMEKNDFFQVSGIVYAQYSGGFFIENGGEYIFVYSYDVSGAVAEGDNITMLGQLGSYNGLLQVYPKSDATINSSSNTPTVGHEVGNVGDLLLDTWQRGTYVTVTGLVSIEGDNSNAYITDIAGNKVEVYYKSDADVVKTFDTKIISVELLAYTGNRVLFYGVAADITEVTTYTDQYKADAAVNAIDLGYLMDVKEDLTLPDTDTLTGAAFVWTTSDPAVVTDAGVITIVAGSTPMATLTVVATVGDATATRDIVVYLIDGNDLLPLTVTEALALTYDVSPKLEPLVTGIITAKYYDEFIIQDPVTGAAIYVDHNFADAKVGDEVVVRGELEEYTSSSNNKMQLDSLSFYEVVSSDNAITVETETDPAVIAAAYKDMKRYSATLTIKEFDGNNVIFTGSTGDDALDIQFDYSWYAPYIMDVYTVGDSIAVTFTVMELNGGNVRVLNVEMPVLTDAQAILAAKGSTTLPVNTKVDLVLPVVSADYGSTISWASNNAAISTAGVVTRPAEGEANVTVTLTATFTSGVETTTMDFDVLVYANYTPVAPVSPLFISEYIEGSSNNKALEIYNPNNAWVALTGYALNQYNNGSSDITISLDLSAIEIAPNDVLVICTDTFAEMSECDIVLTYAENKVVFFNGDDAMTLTKDDVILDLIGVIGVDPGTNWPVGTGATSEYTLVRNSATTGPNSTFTTTEWDVYDQDDFTHLGSHATD